MLANYLSRAAYREQQPRPTQAGEAEYISASRAGLQLQLQLQCALPMRTSLICKLMTAWLSRRFVGNYIVASRGVLTLIITAVSG